MGAECEALSASLRFVTCEKKMERVDNDAPAQMSIKVAVNRGRGIDLVLVRYALEPLQYPTSHSPLALARGLRVRMKSWNRFNGLRKIPILLSKPLKRLTTIPSRPSPQAEAWGE